MKIKHLIIASLVAAAAGVLFAGAPATADTETRNADGSVTTTSVERSTDEYGDTTTATTKTTTWPCTRGQQQVFIETRVEGPQPGGSSRSFSQACESVEGGPGGPRDARREAGLWASVGAGEHGSAATPEVAFGVLVDGPAATGEAAVTVAGRTYTVTLDDQGEGRVELPRTLPAGGHLVNIRYLGDERTLPARSGAGRGPAGGPVYLTVAKADTRLTISMPKSWKKTKRPVATIRVHAEGAPAVGRVEVRVGGEAVTVAVRDGVAKVRLPKAYKGRKTVTVTYTGDRNHEAAKAKRTVRMK